MVELTTTKGALDEATRQRLAGELSTIVLELEAAPFQPSAPSEQADQSLKLSVTDGQVALSDTVDLEPEEVRAGRLVAHEPLRHRFGLAVLEGRGEGAVVGVAVVCYARVDLNRSVAVGGIGDLDR